MSVRKLDEKVNEIHRLIEECKEIAEKEGLTFELDPGYSMGGTYYSLGAIKEYKMDKDDWRISRNEDTGGWLSSTNSCR